MSARAATVERPRWTSIGMATAVAVMIASACGLGARIAESNEGRSSSSAVEASTFAR